MRRVVYLDQNVLSNLAKGLWPEIMAELEGLTAQDLALFPFSWTHRYESRLLNEREFRRNYLRVAEMLSIGVHLQPWTYILGQQARRAYNNFDGGTEPLSDWGDAFLSDPRGELPTGIAKQTVYADAVTVRPEEQRRFKQMYADGLATLRDQRPPTASYDEIQSSYLRGAPQRYLRQLTEWLPLTSRIGDAFGDPKSVSAFFASDTFRQIPFLFLEASVLASLETDEPSRPYQLGDFYDIQWLIYLPYVDFAVTDRNMAAVLSRRSLAAQYGCTVFPGTKRGLTDLLATLRA